MNSTMIGRILLVLSILLGAVPFAFAAMRFAETGTDLRAMWMALAALAGAFAVFQIGKVDERHTNVVLGLCAAAVVVGACLAALVALLLGAHAVFGIWAVATAFALCFAASRALVVLSNSPRTS